ncbi:MAG: peptidase dimerization domain-containing protein, partial [Streptomycetaceae bacterium]|nr:peptidase dimerization domain-containing protein [Streptomycetaceae bacterium]
NAVAIEGGVAGNVIPDACTVTVNFRFAPDRSEDDALAHLREVFAPALDRGAVLEVTDSAPGALPGLGRPSAAAFVAAVGGEPRAKVAWTDVARVPALGVPAVNYGPGDPALAHTRDEYVEIAAIGLAEERLLAWLA